MKRLLKFLPCVALAVALGACSLSGRNGEVDSPAKAFLEYGLRLQPEAYLICIWQVEKTQGEGNGADLQATVTESIKGAKKPGEKFRFQRISDSEVWDFAHLRGGLYYVFLHRGSDGRVSVDVQDPSALWKYSDDLHRIVAQYQKKGYQGHCSECGGSTSVSVRAPSARHR